MWRNPTQPKAAPALGGRACPLSPASSARRPPAPSWRSPSPRPPAPRRQARRRLDHPQARRRHGQGPEGPRRVRHADRAGARPAPRASPSRSRAATIDPATAAGTITHSGGLQLRAGSTRVRLTSFTIGVDKTPSISVKAGKARLHAFSLSLAKAKVARAGLGTTVSGVAVKLSAKGAAALNKAFGVKAFTRGLRIGTATVKATPGQIAFTGGATSLALDPGTAQALTSLGIAAAPAAPATANPDGSLAFPITGGKVDAKTLAGQHHPQRRAHADQGRRPR